MKLAFWWKSWRIISHYVQKILFLRATPSKTWSSRVDCRDLAKSIDIGSRNEGLSMTSTIMSTIWQFDIESSQGMKTTIWLFITLLLIPMGSTVGKWDFFSVLVATMTFRCLKKLVFQYEKFQNWLCQPRVILQSFSIMATKKPSPSTKARFSIFLKWKIQPKLLSKNQQLC